MDQEVISKSADETVKLGERFAKENLHSSSLLLLRGDLGAGKTQFAKGIARFFGLREDEISSPTYALINEYDISSDGISRLYHLDCFRFEKPEELTSFQKTAIETKRRADVAALFNACFNGDLASCDAAEQMPLSPQERTDLAGIRQSVTGKTASTQ